MLTAHGVTLQPPPTAAAAATTTDDEGGATNGVLFTLPLTLTL